MYFQLLNSEKGFCHDFYILKQEFRLKVPIWSRPLQVEDIRHQAIQFQRFLLSAKTLMQLPRLVLQPLLYLRCRFFFSPFPNARCASPMPKPKPNFLEERKVHTKLFALLVQAWGEMMKKKEALFASGHPQLEQGHHWPLNSDPCTSRPVSRQSAVHPTPWRPMGSENSERIVLALILLCLSFWQREQAPSILWSFTAIGFSGALTWIQRREGGDLLFLFWQPHKRLFFSEPLLLYLRLLMASTEYAIVCECVRAPAWVFMWRCCAWISLRVKCGQIKTNIVVMCFATCGHGPRMTPLYSCDQLQWTVLVLCWSLGLLWRRVFFFFLFFSEFPPRLPDRKKIKSVKLQSAHICLLSQQLRLYFRHANDFMTRISCHRL